MSGFELTVSIPADARFAEMLAAVAAQAARQAGCAEPRVAEFGAAVSEALMDCLRALPPGQDSIGVVLRRLTDEIEAVLTCGRRVRVARPVPIDV